MTQGRSVIQPCQSFEYHVFARTVTSSHLDQFLEQQLFPDQLHNTPATVLTVFVSAATCVRTYTCRCCYWVLFECDCGTLLFVMAVTNRNALEFGWRGLRWERHTYFGINGKVSAWPSMLVMWDPGGWKIKNSRRRATSWYRHCWHFHSEGFAGVVQAKHM
jgi:hypothetical protein